MSDIVEFLRARLDEDEAVARAASPQDDPVWWVDFTGVDDRPNIQTRVDDLFGPWRTVAYGVAETDAYHIARHDPARVLREVEAKRAILAQEEEARAHYDHIKSSATYPGVEISMGHVVALATVIRHLASAYADHPDFQQEWAIS
ncbi:hypothetical protein A6411_10770 [Prescottella equi]|uniref:DUF6221 family protein n=1 Tax=Rhodococcus hoagii TaxID=43767 RepID=UPI0009BD4305|nr:DUF6221 family protein [Prescottella equi]OQQ32280.1 hypothetical protein A6411_10770 [Prescottella equi]